MSETQMWCWIDIRTSTAAIFYENMKLMGIDPNTINRRCCSFYGDHRPTQAGEIRTPVVCYEVCKKHDDKLRRCGIVAPMIDWRKLNSQTDANKQKF